MIDDTYIYSIDKGAFAKSVEPSAESFEMDAPTTDSGIDASIDEHGQTTDRSASVAGVGDDSARSEMTPRVRSGDGNACGHGSQAALCRSTSGKARRPYVKEDPDRLYLESDGIVYEIEEAPGLRRIYEHTL